MVLIYFVFLVAACVRSSVSQDCQGCERQHEIADPTAQTTLTDILKELVPRGTQDELTTLVKITKYSTRVVGGIVHSYEFQAVGQKTGQMYSCQMQVYSRVWQKSHTVMNDNCVPLSRRQKRQANFIDLDPNDEGVRFVMWKTLTKYNKESKSQKLTLVRVIRARTEPIMRMRFLIDFEALNQDKTRVNCSSDIYRMPYITDETLKVEMKCSPIKAYRTEMSKETTKVILVVICLGLVKCGFHFIRLVVLAVAGLGGLYMMHKLAQDYNKIQSQWGMGNRPIFGIFKRSTNEDWLKERYANDTQMMSTLIEHDPIGCARKYVCYISSKSPKKLSTSQKNVLGILRTFEWLDTDGEWSRARAIGARSGRRGGCEAAYLQCSYTGAQLNKFMSMFD